MLDFNTIERLNERLYQQALMVQNLADANSGAIADRLNEIAGQLRFTKAMLRGLRRQEDITKTAHWEL